jgi:PAS domain-containing protein
MQGPDPKLYQLMATRVSDYAIFLLDPKGLILSWNAGAAAIKQYSEREVVGKHSACSTHRAMSPAIGHRRS